MNHVYNYLGECVDGVDSKLASIDFAKKDKDGKILTTKDGKPIADYAEPSELVDDQGFDKTNTENNGNYTIQVELPKGTKLCRYGQAGGKTTALAGTKYEDLALPYVKETMQYHEYEVVADGISVKCIVTKGRVAPMFNSHGGVIQFVHPQPILNEIADGKLKEVFTWLERKN